MGFLDILGLGGGSPEITEQNGFNTAVNGLPAGAPQPSPPASPEEHQQRVSGWQQFMTKMQTDPAMQQMLFHVGTQLMQPIPRGQTQLGHLGRAMQGGQMYLQFLRQNEDRAKNDAEKMRMEQEKNQATIEHTRQQTAASTQRMQQDAELFPQTKQRLAQELQNLQVSGRLNEAKALQAEFDADPGRMAEMWGLDKKDKVAGIGAKNASAASAGMNAKLHGRQLEELDKDSKALDSVPGGRKAKALGAGGEFGKMQIELDTLEAVVPDTVTDPEMRRREATRLYVQKEARKGNTQAMNAVAQLVNAGIMTEEEGKAATTELLPQKSGAATDAGAWEKARNSVKPGQKYVGPDGVTYTRK